MNRQRVIIIGSGFAGLSAACFLAQGGCDVTVVEKHALPGGRARKFEADGFVFDMGPSWYWMPDVFERFFARFDTQVSDFYHLQQLDPGFSVIFGGNDVVDIPASHAALSSVFESMEPGASARLQTFLTEAKYKYETGMRDLVYRPGLRWSELLDTRLIRGVLRLGMLQSYASHVRKYFKDPRLIRIMEFPVLFLGSTPRKIPALYSLMTYAGLSLGTWYPMGGMYEIVDAMHRLAVGLGVRFMMNTEVSRIHVVDGVAQSVETNQGALPAEHVIASADYHHVESSLIDPEYRTYDERYWQSRTLAPSAIIYYLGVNRRIPRLRHHNLFFDASFDAHVNAIYGQPAMPHRPLFYVCAPSVTDESVAPPGCENLFVLVPLSTELEDSDLLRNDCFEKVMQRLEAYTGLPVRAHVMYQRSYAMRDFREDYHALRGNAYGLANTLMQTANLKPSIRSSKVSNLIYAGQLTLPGPGVPPALISGEIAANLILSEHVKQPANTYAAGASL